VPLSDAQTLAQIASSVVVAKLLITKRARIPQAYR